MPIRDIHGHNSRYDICFQELDNEITGDTDQQEGHETRQALFDTLNELPHSIHLTNCSSKESPLKSSFKTFKCAVDDTSFPAMSCNSVVGFIGGTVSDFEFATALDDTVRFIESLVVDNAIICDISRGSALLGGGMPRVFGSNGPPKTAESLT